MANVVGLGEILWDIMPGGTKHLGGAPLNVAVHAQALGAVASIISAVGDDELGHAAVEQISRDYRLDAPAVQINPNRPTGAVDVRIKDGQPTYEFRADVAWDYLETAAPARTKISAADAIVFGTLAQRSPVSRKAIRDLLALAPPGCINVFDVNVRPPFYNDIIIRDSLAAAHVLKLNSDELPIVLSAIGANGSEIGRLFSEWPQLRVVAVTRGESGSTLHTRDEPGGHTLPAYQVAVKDTVGAGDAFTAALITGLLERRDLEAIHNRAVAAAAFVCTQVGATPALPGDLI